MRKVAEALGAGTMSLYHYVKTRDELLTLMHDTVIGELNLPYEPEGDWRAEMVRVGTGIRAIAARHPWISELSYPTDPGPNFAKLREYLLAIDHGGLEGTGKLDLVRTVLAFVYGFIAIEASERAAADIARRPSSEDEALYGRLVADVEPHLDLDAMFNRQLGYVLSGLEAEILEPMRRRDADV